MVDSNPTAPIFLECFLTEEAVQALNPAPLVTNNLQERGLDLKAEIVEVKTENGPIDAAILKCSECNFSLKTEDQLIRHIRKVHRGENPYQCTYCNYTTYNSVVFQEHVRIHQGIKPYKCSYCPYRSVSKKSTKRHERKHRPDNPLRCKECPFIANNGRVLNHHARTHLMSSDQVFSCDHCGARFKTLITLEKHFSLRKTCRQCSLTLCLKLYKEHLEMAHGFVAKSRQMEREFACAVCGWGGASKHKVLLHLIHHPAQPPPGDVDVEPLRALGILPPGHRVQ